MLTVSSLRRSLSCSYAHAGRQSFEDCDFNGAQRRGSGFSILGGAHGPNALRFFTVQRF
jgi:hypothetical protein